MKSIRHGFTLIEMLVVMMFGSLLMGLSIEVLEQALSLDTTTKARLQKDRTLNLLADQFRSDVRYAATFTLDSPDKIVLENSDSSISYSLDGTTIRRAETFTSDVVRNEQYALGDGRVATFSRQQSPDRTLLTIQFNTGLKQTALRPERVIAAVTGQRQRLLSDASGDLSADAGDSQ